MKLLSLVNKQHVEIFFIDIEAEEVNKSGMAQQNQLTPDNIGQSHVPLMTMLGMGAFSNEILASLQTQMQTLSLLQNQVNSTPPLPATNQSITTEEDKLPLTRSEVNQMIQNALIEFEKKIDLKIQQAFQHYLSNPKH